MDVGRVYKILFAIFYSLEFPCVWAAVNRHQSKSSGSHSDTSSPRCPLLSANQNRHDGCVAAATVTSISLFQRLSEGAVDREVDFIDSLAKAWTRCWISAKKEDYMRNP